MNDIKLDTDSSKREWREWNVVKIAGINVWTERKRWCIMVPDRETEWNWEESQKLGNGIFYVTHIICYTDTNNNIDTACVCMVTVCMHLIFCVPHKIYNDYWIQSATFPLRFVFHFHLLMVTFLVMTLCVILL